MSKVNSRREDGWSWKIRLIGTILSIILLVWLLSRQDWASIFQAIGKLALWHVLLSILLILVRHLFNGLRWIILVRALGIPFTYFEALRLVFSGIFVSNFLPSMVGGDVVRIAGVLQKTDKRVAGVASVVVDRLIGGIGMFVALPFSIPLFGTFFGPGVLLGGFISDFRPRVSTLLRSTISRLSNALKHWTSQPERLLLSLLATWASMMVNFVAVWILARGLGMTVTLGEVVGASAITYYLTIIPLSINGYGIRELAVVGLYTQLGSTPEQASALALLSRSIFMLVSLLGAIWVGKVFEYGNTRAKYESEEELG